MNKTLLLLLLLTVTGSTSLSAQDLKLFNLSRYEIDSTKSIAFISLSDVHFLSEHTDSLAVPDLTYIEADSAANYEYIRLNSAYRERFLSGTKLSETDKVFIYDYAADQLLSFKVKDLDVVACLNIYGAEWPYGQYDYMIGFGISEKKLTGLDKYFTHALVYIGKESPFVKGQVKPVEWKKTKASDFPSKALTYEDTAAFHEYLGDHQYHAGDTYSFERDSLNYFVRDYILFTDDWLFAKQLVVIDTKTGEAVCKKQYFSGESLSFAPLDNQWTGTLFKNKPPVIFGFNYVSFGCPSITFLSKTEPDVYINCDNRH